MHPELSSTISLVLMTSSIPKLGVLGDSIPELQTRLTLLKKIVNDFKKTKPHQTEELLELEKKLEEIQEILDRNKAK